ncbi:uncharacterized protein LOC127858623 [Dreissena polymorpha]|uniref:C2H2-type domain-containing protein n=1 Tax=Dreissena polymorpha TaxID=45954 RepID=A0A9D3Z0C3_DREPO|nr:uncharacterized protein LOC127858623 [Dreissena polymorpha]KAH3707789.1 hypothetical protein DPMN_067205 [Dreissena polymorpha]
MDTKRSNILEIPEIQVATEYEKVQITSNRDSPLESCSERLVDVNEHKSNSLADETSSMDFEFVSSDLDHGTDFTIDNSSVFGLADSVIVGTHECDDFFRDSPCFNGPGCSRPIYGPGTEVALLSETTERRLLPNIGLSLQIIPLNNLHYISTVQTNKGIHILAVPGRTSVKNFDGNILQSLSGPDSVQKCSIEEIKTTDSIITTQSVCDQHSFSHYNILNNDHVPKIATENSLNCKSFTPIKEHVFLTSSKCRELTSVKDMCKSVISPNVFKLVSLDAHFDAEQNDNNVQNSSVNGHDKKMISLLKSDNFDDLPKVIKPFKRKCVKLTIPLKGIKTQAPKSSVVTARLNKNKSPVNKTKSINSVLFSQVCLSSDDAALSKPSTEVSEEMFDDLGATKFVSFVQTSSEVKEIPSSDSSLAFECIKSQAVFAGKGNLKKQFKASINEYDVTDTESFKRLTYSDRNKKNTDCMNSVDKTETVTLSNLDGKICLRNTYLNILGTSQIITEGKPPSTKNAKSLNVGPNYGAETDAVNQEIVKGSNECLICNISFKTKGNLTRHQLLHSQSGKTSRFTCSVCNKGFLQRCDLKRHTLTHKDGHPHRCNTCKKGFLRRSDLVLHEQYHLGSRSHSCRLCSKSYIKQGDLSRHVRQSHATVCQYRCSSCSMGFSSQMSLYAHTRIKHSQPHDDQ